MSDYDYSYERYASRTRPTKKQPIKEPRIRKLNYEWSAESSKSLVEHVERFPNLWDQNNRSYKDRKRQQRSWDTIAMVLGVPKSELIVKWNSIRGNYRQIYFKCLTQKDWAKNRRINPLFKSMTFLDPVLMLKADSIIKPESIEISQNSQQSSPLHSPSSSEEMNLDSLFSTRPPSVASMRHRIPLLQPRNDLLPNNLPMLDNASESLINCKADDGDDPLYFNNERESSDIDQPADKKPTSYLDAELKIKANIIEMDQTRLSSSPVCLSSSDEMRVEAVPARPKLPTAAHSSTKRQRLPLPGRTRDDAPTQPASNQQMLKKAYEMLVNCGPDDEWHAFGNLVASNARTWSKEDMGFARRYKAALAAVNAQYEMEAATNTTHIAMISYQHMD